MSSKSYEALVGGARLILAFVEVSTLLCFIELRVTLHRKSGLHSPDNAQLLWNSSFLLQTAHQPLYEISPPVKISHCSDED
mmetsp:Transcript_74637/g.199844  ORF Transcript_74637/g.199844 Transcript_74637/m.199844 type:complete len:81 (-) Transcript_74637:337-579(-)